MGEARLVPRHVVLFAAADFANYRDGRLREDTVSIVLLARIPNSVGILLHLTNTF